MGLNAEWFENIPGHDYEGAISFLNSLYWNLSFEKVDNQLKVFTGEILLYKSTNEQDVESFILGLALGLAVLPEEMHEQIRKLAGD